MERRLHFKPPRIERRTAMPVQSPGVEFYTALVEQQNQMNVKVRNFEAEMQDRNSRELSMLQVRNEKQQQAVKQFEQEAAKDQAWERFVNNVQKLGVSQPIRAYVASHLSPTMEQRTRKPACDKLLEDMMKGTVGATVQDMKDIGGLMELSANVTTDPRPVLQLAAVLAQLHMDISAAAQRGAAASTVDEMRQAHSDLGALLRHQAVARLECDAKLGSVVGPARQVLSDTHRKVEANEKRLHEYAQQQELEKERSKQAKAAAASSAAGSAHVLDAQFPYLGASKKIQAWLEELRLPAMQSGLPQELEAQLQLAVQSIRHASLLAGDIFGSTGGEEDEMMGGSSVASSSAGAASGAGVPLRNVDRLLSGLENLLHGVVKGGAQSFLRVFITLSEAVLEEVQTVTAEEDIKMYAVVVCGMFRALSVNMYKQSARIFHALLLSQSRRCVPDLFCVTGGTASRVLVLFAALVGQSVEAEVTATGGGGKVAEVKVSSPLTAAQGWTWLQRAVVQLHAAVTLRAAGQTDPATVNVINQLNLSENSVPEICKLVRTFIRLAGNSLALKYQDKFVELLGALSKTLQVKAATAVLSGVDAKKLLALVESGISAKYVAPAYYRSQAPFMLDAASLTRYADRERQAVALAEQDKKCPFMVRVKELQIDRLRVIFNKLSVTAESQKAAVSSLLEKIIISNKESPDFLKYTLFKIAANIASDCQEEFFNEMDEGHPLKLARVSVGLCASIKELGDLIKAQFFKQCPLCIPKAAEVGLSGEDFLRDMGFKAKNTTSGEVKWEDKSQWLARMSKMLCTYCVIMIQPEQYPLSLGDAWAWLAQLVNLSTPRPALPSLPGAATAAGAADTGPKPPFFTATALEVMLRVTGLELHRAYGDTFMALLVLVQDRVIPNLAADMPRREELRKFLQSFTSSRGADFLSLFNKPVTAAA